MTKKIQGDSYFFYNAVAFNFIIFKAYLMFKYFFTLTQKLVKHNFCHNPKNLRDRRNFYSTAKSLHKLKIVTANIKIAATIYCITIAIWLQILLPHLKALISV